MKEGTPFARRKFTMITASAMTSALLSLTACGGGGGGVSSTPLPLAPTSTPSPTPTPTPPPATAGPAGFYPLPADAPLVAYGGGVTQTETGTAATFAPVSYAQGQVQIDYDPATMDYAISIPSYPAGRTVEDPDSTVSQWHRFFNLVNSTTQQGVGFVSVARKAQLNLTYSAIAAFSGHRLGSDGVTLNDQIYLVTGQPTPPGDVPLSGSATYSALAKGWATAGTDLEGKFLLNFDFASSTLGGRLDLSANDGTGGYGSVGSFPVINGTHLRGATSFAGNFGGVSSTGPASFEGIFMGPGAAEVGGRWQLQVRIPETFPAYLAGTHAAAGVFAGARQ